MHTDSWNCVGFMYDSEKRLKETRDALKQAYDEHLFSVLRKEHEKVMANSAKKVREQIEGEYHDAVNHPHHYTMTSIECIDAMVETQGLAATADYCICNTFKYLWRHRHKNGVEDVKKAAWYLNKYIELVERIEVEAGL